MNDINLGRLRAHMREMEGEKLVTYRDSLGHVTGGIGHLMPPGTEVGVPLTEEQVASWFEGDVAKAYAGARGIAGATGWLRAGEVRREVLVDCCFQLGTAGTRRFRKMVEAFLEGNWGVAAIEHLDSRMAKQTPRRAMKRAKALVYGAWT